MFSRLKVNHQLQLLFKLFITIISFGSFITNAADTIGPARNLTVSAFQDYKYYENINFHENFTTEGLLKLNISWLPPETGGRPVSYSIVVTSIQNESFVDPTVCPAEETLYYTTKDRGQLYVELPEDLVIFGVPELAILPGCIYGVQVFANPRKNPNVNHPNVEYRVPECVGLKCSCANIEKVLPKPEVEVKRIVNGDILIKWKIATNYDNIKSYSISFGVPILVSRGGLPVYNGTEIARVSSKNHSFIWSNVSESLDGIIYVVAEDWKGCFGPEGSYLISPIEDNYYHRETMMVLIGSVIISLVILGTLSMLWSHDRKKYKIIGHSNTTDDNDLQFPERISHCILTKRNELYVEQEVEEAIRNGKADAFEVSYSRLKFEKELGKGEFGEVYLAKIDGFESSSFAVKVMNTSISHNDVDSRTQLLEEIAIMKLAGSHPHLVQLIGCCSLPENPVCAILEYLEGGDLLAYLHDIRKRLFGSLESFATDPTTPRSPRPSLAETLYTTLGSEPPTTPTSHMFESGNKEIIASHNYVNTQSQLSSALLATQERSARNRGNSIGLESDEFLRFAMEIAKGMMHLEAKGITHRDLAARNILLDSNLTLKVSDFGLSRNGIYVISGSGRTRRLPVRWMSPEAMRDREFSSKSDVWSYAVVLWEIGTLGAFPYPNILDDQLLRHVVVDKKRLLRPEAISIELYSVMQACWTSRPNDRPNFSQLLSRLMELGAPSYSSYGTSNPCYTSLPPTEEELQDNSPPAS